MTHREDGLIGNGLFQDKVVEIDYDRHGDRDPRDAAAAVGRIGSSRT